MALPRGGTRKITTVKAGKSSAKLPDKKGTAAESLCPLTVEVISFLRGKPSIDPARSRLPPLLLRVESLPSNLLATQTLRVPQFGDRILFLAARTVNSSPFSRAKLFSFAGDFILINGITVIVRPKWYRSMILG